MKAIGECFLPLACDTCDMHFIMKFGPLCTYVNKAKWKGWNE